MFRKNKEGRVVGLSDEGFALVETLAGVLASYGEEHGQFQKGLDGKMGFAPLNFINWLGGNLKGTGLNIGAGMWSRSSYEMKRNLTSSY